MLRLRRVSRVSEPRMTLLGITGPNSEFAGILNNGIFPVQEITPEFADPMLEIVRLLHEAAEIEHALLVQYLYAAFSLKPKYGELFGSGFPDSSSLLGVAIEEMRHLASVNRFLGILGAPPNFGRQDFPYEPEIYPFAMSLEPLSPYTLAKYVFTEAPADRLEPDGGEDPAFLQQLFAFLGPGARPNHIGSLYSAVIELVDRLQTNHQQLGIPDLAGMRAELERIKDDGEIRHFEFFRAVFLGTHPAIRPGIWDLDPVDPDYPSFPGPRDPSALLGHERQIQNPRHLRMARFGNLIYWIVLAELDTASRFAGAEGLKAVAIDLMSEVLAPIGQALAAQGSGLPFDPLSLGYTVGADLVAAKRWILRLLDEAIAAAKTAAVFDPYLEVLTLARANLL